MGLGLGLLLRDGTPWVSPLLTLQRGHSGPKEQGLAQGRKRKPGRRGTQATVHPAWASWGRGQRPQCQALPAEPPVPRGRGQWRAGRRAPWLPTPRPPPPLPARSGELGALLPRPPSRADALRGRATDLRAPTYHARTLGPGLPSSQDTMPEGGGGDVGEVPALITDGEPLREEVPALSDGDPEPALERGKGDKGRANSPTRAEEESCSPCGQ